MLETSQVTDSEDGQAQGRKRRDNSAENHTVAFVLFLFEHVQTT